MPNVLVVAEHSGRVIRKATWSALSAARQLGERVGGAVHVALLGQALEPLADELTTYGVTVHVADAPLLQHYLAESWAPVVADAVRAAGASYVCAGATSFGKDLLPRVAARLGAAMASEVLSFGGEGAHVTFHRPMWAGNVLAEVELGTAIKVFTVRPTEFSPARPGGIGATIPLAVSLNGAMLRSRHLSFHEVKSARPELTEARIVIAGGRGTKGSFVEVEALADELGAAVGATRAAVDAGWVPNDWQVGQTGKVVAPELYLAAGISGAIQHVAGMKGSRIIVAINKDAEAPIFQIADYGLVADLFQALPELRAKLKGSR